MRGNKKVSQPSVHFPAIIHGLSLIIKTIFSIVLSIIISASKTARNNPDQGIIHGRRDHKKDDR